MNWEGIPENGVVYSAPDEKYIAMSVSHFETLRSYAIDMGRKDGKQAVTDELIKILQPNDRKQSLSCMLHRISKLVKFEQTIMELAESAKISG